MKFSGANVDREYVGMVDQAMSASVFDVAYSPVPPRRWWDLWRLLFPPRPIARMVFGLELDFAPVVPSNVVFVFEHPDGDDSMIAVDDGRGVLMGDGAGRIDYETGKFTLVPTHPVPPGTRVLATYVYDVGRS